MSHRTLIAAAFAVASAFASSSARAEERSPDVARAEWESRAPVTAGAIEIGVAAGYAQAFGGVASGRPRLSDWGSAGGAAEVKLGYRLNSYFALGVYAAGSRFAGDDAVASSARIYSAAAGVEAQWHAAPRAEIDPWVGIGTGWRGYWVDGDQGTTAWQGWDIARLQLGADYRLGRQITVSPVLGASVSTLFGESPAGDHRWHNLDGPRLDTFLFGGFMGRFDFGVRASPVDAVASL